MFKWFERIFVGRWGMDELSKALFWCGLLLLLLSAPIGLYLSAGLGSIIRWLGLFALIYAFVRAFSRRLDRREAENQLYLDWLNRRRQSFNAFKERRRQSKNYRFFKCPGCGAMLRVPRGKGKIHIKCRCGYTLYRKT